MTNKAARWCVAIGYVAFIYATLDVVGRPVAALRAHGLLRRTLATLTIGCYAALLAALLKGRSQKIARAAALTGVFAAYVLIAHFVVKWPEEQIHFFEYGLVGVLFLRAIISDWGVNIKSVLLALVLAGAAGWVDELIQGLIPSRHYDVRDVALNVVSAGLGLLVYAVARLEKREAAAVS